MFRPFHGFQGSNVPVPSDVAAALAARVAARLEPLPGESGPFATPWLEAQNTPVRVAICRSRARTFGGSSATCRGQRRSGSRAAVSTNPPPRSILAQDTPTVAVLRELMAVPLSVPCRCQLSPE